VREVQLAKGFSNLPVWITETGREARIDNPGELETQRKYTERVMQAQNQRSWWQRTFIYELSEEHPNGLWPDIHWGLALRVKDFDSTYADNWQRKPAFDELKGCIAASPTGSGGTGGTGGAAGGGNGGSGGGAGSPGGGGAGAGGTSAGGTSGGGTSAGGASSGGSGALAGSSGSAGAPRGHRAERRVGLWLRRGGR